MKKIIAFITVMFLIPSMFGSVYAEDAIEKVVPGDIQEVPEATEAVELTELENTEVEETNNGEYVEAETEESEETIYTLYELLPFKNDNWSFSSHFGFDLYTEEEFELFYEYVDKIKLTKYDGVVEEGKDNKNAYLVKHLLPNKRVFIYLFPEYVKIDNKISDGDLHNDISFYKYVTDYSDFVTDMQEIKDTIYQWKLDEVRKSIVKDESLNDLVFTSTEVRDPYKGSGDIGRLIDTDNAEKIYITNKEGITFRINKDLQRDKLKRISLSGLSLEYVTVKLADETVLYKIDVDDGRQMMYITEKHVIFRDEELDRTLIFNCESDISLFVNHQVNSRDNDKMIQKLMDLEAIGLEQLRRTKTQYFNFDYGSKVGEIAYTGVFKVKLDDSYKGTNFYKYADSNNEVKIEIEISAYGGGGRIKVGGKNYFLGTSRWEEKYSLYPRYEIVNGKSLRMDEAETFYIQMLEYNSDYTFSKLRLCIDTTYNVNTRRDPNPAELVSISQTGSAKTINLSIGMSLKGASIPVKAPSKDEIKETEKEAPEKEVTEPIKVEQQDESVKLSKNQISKLKDSGIMVGDPDGNLRLEDTITRAETVKVLCTATEIETEDTEIKEEFSDVGTEHWAYEYINKAQNTNIINGYGDSTFKPENRVTYNEFIKMLVCVTGYADKAEEKGGYPNGYIAVAEEIGITEGIVFKGNDEVTRNDVGIMILNVLNVLK